MNWLYDHLRHLPDYEPIVICDELMNRAEFPDVTAWDVRQTGVVPSIRRRLGIKPRALARAAKRNPSVLHSHFGYTALVDFRLRRDLDVPWVVSFYGADVYQLASIHEGQDRYRKLFASCARVLALGPVMAQRLISMGCPEDKMIVHPLGISASSIPYRTRVWDRSGPLKVLFAGTIREKKGVKYALKGVAAARDAGVPIQLRLVGEPTDKPGDREIELEVQAKIAELDLSSVVVRDPLLPFDELMRIALDSHVFLAPSITASDGDSEGTPFVIQQMMASSMPVIATRHSDIPYVFGDLSELLVEEKDAEAIAARLVEYSDAPELLAEHGSVMRERIVDDFDIVGRAAALSKVYESL